MNIKRLKSENVKRLSVVEITPDGQLITIGGKNGSGKSSVLDSIAYALGGEKLVPTQPIRTGEADAKITIDLGDYIVTRRFHRDKLVDCDCEQGADKTDPALHASDCVIHTRPPSWGPTKSVLVVTNREGAKYPSPQVLLDKLYGKLTFDPLAFSNEKPATQNEILRRIVGLDFTAIDLERRVHFEQRAMDKKTLQIEEHKLEQLPRHLAPSGVYEVATTDIDDLSARLRLGQALEKDAQAAQQVAAGELGKLQALEQTRNGMLSHIEELEKELAAAHARLAQYDAQIREQKTRCHEKEEHARTALSAVPDFSAIHAALLAANKMNERARDNKTYLMQASRVKELEEKVATGTIAIEQIDADKEASLKAAQFPVEGLSLSDDGVMFEGLPLSEVSASVQLRVSIAIGLALNPTLKVLLIRNGNLLDEDGLRMVAEQAEHAGAQVWMEYVTSHADGVSVMLEDGHLA